MPELLKPARIRKLGTLRHFKTLSGNTVVVLPTCSVPLERLVEENWHPSTRKRNKGNVRQVYQVTRLVDGTLLKPEERLFIKNPERVFSAVTGNWRNAHTEPKVRVSGNVVEEQAKWEARFLVGLANNSIPAEKPQAIIIHRDGRKELVTRGMAEDNLANRKIISSDLLSRAKALGAVPSRDAHSNIFYDLHHAPPYAIIDVNRWEWKQPPESKRKGVAFYDTDKYHRRLLKAVAEAVAESEKKRKK